MTFWTDLPTFTGATNRVIRMEGAFQMQQCKWNMQGPRDAYSYFDGTSQVITDRPQWPHTPERVKLYWLPWLNLNITSVTMKELNASGCDYFLTSTFSGCRWVATEELVAHVAYAQTRNGPQNSATRDHSQLHNLHGGKRPSRMRTMSLSGHGSQMATNDFSVRTYSAGDDPYSGRAVVVGYKSGAKWHFVQQTFREGATTGFWEKMIPV